MGIDVDTSRSGSRSLLLNHRNTMAEWEISGYNQIPRYLHQTRSYVVDNLWFLS